jgi:hypothetical protein
MKKHCRRGRRRNDDREETERLFVNPNEDDNDDVIVSDETRDEQLYAYPTI